MLGDMDSNPFADLIPSQANPFQDLLPSSKPTAPDWREEEARGNLAAIQAAQPAAQTKARGTFLPLERNLVSNKLSLAVPEFIRDPATLPGDVYTGKTAPADPRALGFAAMAAGPRILPTARLRTAMQPSPKTAAGEATLAVPTGAEASKALKSSGGRMMNVAKSDDSIPVEHGALREAMTNLNKEMRESTIRPDAKLHPNSAYLYGRLLDLVRAPKPKPLDRPGFTGNPPPKMRAATMQELQELDEIASQVISKGWDQRRNQATPDGKLGAMMKNTIREMMAKHPNNELLMAGKSEYSRGAKSQSILNLVEKASKTTQWDRGDHAGAIRNQVNSFLKSKDSRYLTNDEVRDLKRIKRYGLTEALGGQGSLSPMQLTIGRAVEAMFGIPPGGLYVAGKLARETANVTKPKQLENLAERIRAGK